MKQFPKISFNQCSIEDLLGSKFEAMIPFLKENGYTSIKQVKEEIQEFETISNMKKESKNKPHLTLLKEFFHWVVWEDI